MTMSNISCAKYRDMLSISLICDDIRRHICQCGEWPTPPPLIDLVIFHWSTITSQSLRTEHKRNVRLKTRLMVTVTRTSDDLWLAMTNSFLLGYPSNKGPALDLLTRWNLWELFIPKSMLFPFSITTSELEHTPEGNHTFPPRRISGRLTPVLFVSLKRHLYMTLIKM